jgi:ribonuclease Z
MKRFLAVLVTFAALCGCDRLIDRQIEQNLGRVRQDLIGSSDMHVFLCGTGSPLPDRSRAAACTAVIAGGNFVLVDVGPGSWENVDLENLPTASLSAIMLTHFHSDHIGELGEAITQSWIAGRRQQLDVYGPVGTTHIVDGLRQVYAADVDYRVAHHGDENMPRATSGAVGHDITLGPEPDASATVFDLNGLKVTMFRVDHTPVDPAVGYRFDYRGRSVVISGDTRKSASLTEHAKGADILIHEALRSDLIQRAKAAAERTGNQRLAKLAGDIVDYHTSPLEAAEVARDAGVHHLVLTHLVPGPNNFLLRRMFVAGVADIYSGEVTIGEDGLELTLEPAEGS